MKVIIVTLCSYTVIGISLLFPEAEVTQVKNPEDLIEIISGRDTVIIVDLPRNDIRTSVCSRLFLYNLNRLCSVRVFCSQVPYVLLLGEDRGDFLIPYPHCSWISTALPVDLIRARVIKYMTRPSLNNCRCKVLTNHQYFVLMETLKGKGVSEISNEMNLCVKHILQLRLSAIKRIGLRNLNELAWVMGQTIFS